MACYVPIVLGISERYFVVLDARVEVVRPRVLFEEVLSRLLDAHVWQDHVIVHRLARDGASVSALFIEVTVFIRLPLSSPFSLNFKAPLNGWAFKCLTALDEDWIGHEVSRYRAKQMIGWCKLLLSFESFTWHHFAHLSKEWLCLDSVLLRHFFDDFQLTKCAQLLLEISKGGVLVLFVMCQVS